MSVLLKKQVRELCFPSSKLTKHERINFKPMLVPYEERKASRFKHDDTKENIMLSTNIMNFGYDLHVDFGSTVSIMPPKSYMVIKTIEHLYLPRHVSCIVYGKKALFKIGLLCETIFLNSGYSGNISVKIHNLTNRPIKLSKIRKVLRIIFFQNQFPF